MVNRRKVRDIKQSNYVWIKYDLRNSTITDDDKKRTDGDYEIVRYYNANDLYKEDFDWDNSKSLGMSLIKLLSERQLNGSLELNREQGTCFTIKFEKTGIKEVTS